MPQASAYLPDESDSLTSDDTQRLDNSKPETWPLLLPSDIPRDERSPCHKKVIETERALRLAQLQDSLAGLRQSRRALRNLRLYFKKNMAGEGVKTQTKSRTIETNANDRINRAVWRYRTAHRALLELDPTGDWAAEYRELRDEDNRGPLKEAEEGGTGDGRYIPSWIWAAPSAMVLPGEGSAAEQQEINETVRHEWMTCRARADRWKEEEELLQEEMRRVIVFLEWKSRTWFEKVGNRAGSCTPDIQHGVDAYARRQANVYRELAISFAGQWLPYLNACRLETKWAVFPWVSQVLSRKTKPPKWFPTIPQDTPRVPPTTDSSTPDATEGLGTEQEDSDARKAQDEGGNYGERERGEHYSDEDSDDEEQDPDCEDEDYDYEGCDYESYDYEGYDEGYDDEGGVEANDDGVETNDEFGFEYDDEYMS